MIGKNGSLKLCGYIVFLCLSARVWPFKLVYGAELVLPVEVEILALRPTIEADWNPSQKAYAHGWITALENLEECQDVSKKLQRYREQMEPK